MDFETTNDTELEIVFGSFHISEDSEHDHLEKINSKYDHLEKIRDNFKNCKKRKLYTTIQHAKFKNSKNSSRTLSRTKFIKKLKAKKDRAKKRHSRASVSKLSVPSNKDVSATNKIEKMYETEFENYVPYYRSMYFYCGPLYDDLYDSDDEFY